MSYKNLSLAKIESKAKKWKYSSVYALVESPYRSSHGKKIDLYSDRIMLVQYNLDNTILFVMSLLAAKEILIKSCNDPGEFNYLENIQTELAVKHFKTFMGIGQEDIVEVIKKDQRYTDFTTIKVAYLKGE